MVSTKDAKQLYFLAADDLAALQCYRFGGGIGCGPPMKMYRHEHLVEASLDKHGRAGVLKKLEARRKREEKKRQKEEQAELARKRMKTSNDNAGNTNSSSTTPDKSSAAGKDTPEIKKLRGSLLKLAKKNLGFERSGAPKNWRFEVPGTSTGTFAALMNRPADVDLDTFVKNGAYYTIDRHDAMELFGVKDEEKLVKQFKREMVGQRIASYVVVRYKPSAMELSVSGYAEICSSGYF